jgi:hypothetical protein
MYEKSDKNRKEEARIQLLQPLGGCSSKIRSLARQTSFDSSGSSMKIRKP